MARRVLLAALLAVLVLTAAAPSLQTAGIPLTELGAQPFEALQGPFDELLLTFQLPGSWRLQEGSELSLSLQNFFSSFVPAQAEALQEELVAGHISVAVDGNLVQRQVLNQNGELLLNVPLSPDVFTASGFEHTLSIAWDASASCDLNLSSTIIIDPQSALTLIHAEGLYTPLLAELPYPFFATNPVEREATLVVLPAAPSEAQLAAALTLVAGLGRVSDDPIEFVTEDQLTTADRASHHLIFVGPISAFQLLGNVNLPHESSNAANTGDAAIGFAEIVVSPWNNERTMVVVSGGSDTAIVNAARHTASGGLVANNAGTLAVVEGAAELAAPPDTEATTFAQLGLADVHFDRYGRSEVSLPFYVDPDRPISQQAYIDLRFAHSELVDYLRSGLSVSLNDQPLASSRLSDQSAGRHSEVLLVSPTALRRGWNELTISADVLPLDLCATTGESQTWLTIYSDSTLNLPTAEAALEPTGRGSLGDLSPFLANGMQNTALVLPSERPQAWSAAAELLRGLAEQSWPLLPSVYFAQNFAAAPVEENAVFIGNFEDFATLPGLAAAFSVNTAASVITLSTGDQIPYGPDIPVGFVQAGTLADGRQVLAIWGNSNASVLSAAQLLTEPTFQQRNSNASLVVLQGQILLRDEGTSAVEETAPDAEAAQQASPVSTGKGIYLYLLLLLFLVAVGLVLWQQLYPVIRKRFFPNLRSRR